MLATIARWGVWKRAGMSAVLCGLDLTEAMASIPSGLDRDLAHRLFVIAEAAYVPASLALARDKSD